MIYSYDIFDTCLSRICGKQDLVFELLAFSIMGNKASKSQIRDFVSERRKGETLARKSIINPQKEDVTIEDIYDNCNFSHLCNNDSKEILEKEILQHKTSLVPIYSVLDEINELHKNGNHIVYISDMYLHSSVLIEILKEKGFYKDGDMIFVSCDIGLTKNSGHLYDFVKKEIHADYNEWTHSGDNRHSDYDIPRKKGIKAILKDSDFSYYEKKTIEKEFSGSEVDIYKIASIERSVRLSLPNEAKYRFASNFVAPIYVPFVYHVLCDAQKHNRSLFFVARDGYILYLIAKQLHSLFPSVSISYLYASRKSLYLSGIKEISPEGIMETVPFKGNVTVHDILSILHLSKFEINGEEYVNKSPHDIITTLLYNPAFVKELNSVYKSQSELTIQYFKEQGLTKQNSAIVDVFGTRKCQYFINNIMERNGYPQVYGYYYEVLTDRINDNSQYYALNYQEQLKLSIHDTYLTQKQQLFEQYFSITDHDRTGGYQLDNNGNIAPIFDNDLIDKTYKKTIFNANKKVCILFANYYSTLHIKNHEHCSRIAQSVFNHFFHIPRKEYLEVLKSFKESDDGYARNLLTKKNVLLLFFNSDKFCTWMQGNAVYNSGIFYNIIRWILYYIWKRNNKKKISLS